MKYPGSKSADGSKSRRKPEEPRQLTFRSLKNGLSGFRQVQPAEILSSKKDYLQFLSDNLGLGVKSTPKI